MFSKCEGGGGNVCLFWAVIVWKKARIDYSPDDCLRLGKGFIKGECKWDN